MSDWPEPRTDSDRLVTAEAALERANQALRRITELDDRGSDAAASFRFVDAQRIAREALAVRETDEEDDTTQDPGR